MVGTGAGPMNIFRAVYQIQLADIQHQSNGYFGLLGIVNVGINTLPNTLAVSSLTNLSDGDTIEVQIFYDRVGSDMIAKSI